MLFRSNIAKGVRGNVNHDVVMSLPECTETNGEPSILQRNSVDKSPPGKKVLQREQSDLELGELREGSLENDTERTRRQFERNSSEPDYVRSPRTRNLKLKYV